MKPYLSSLDNLCATDFHINYHSELFAKGYPTDLDFIQGMEYFKWSFKEGKEYWDFDLVVGPISISDVTNKVHRNINIFSKPLRQVYADFIDELEQTKESLQMLELKECLRGSLLKLKKFHNFYSTIPINYSYGLIRQNFSSHDLLTVIASPEEKHCFPDFINFSLSFYFDEQRKQLDLAINELNIALESLSKDSIDELPEVLETGLQWKASDTDLLELIVGLLETNSLSSKSGNLSRKELVTFFEKVFSIELKDFESKLSRATERKRDTSPYLTKLKQSFDNYCDRKLERQE